MTRTSFFQRICIRSVEKQNLIMKNPNPFPIWKIEQIRSLEASVDVFDTEIDRLLSGFDTQLTTITGIDPTLAAVILSEIGGDIRRFSSSAKLAAYAGVDPTVKQSGDFSGTRMKMSKRGSPYLRRAIWLASTVAAFKDSAIHAFYERKRAEGIDHMTVIGHKS